MSLHHCQTFKSCAQLTNNSQKEHGRENSLIHKPSKEGLSKTFFPWQWALCRLTFFSTFWFNKTVKPNTLVIGSPTTEASALYMGNPALRWRSVKLWDPISWALKLTQNRATGFQNWAFSREGATVDATTTRDPAKSGCELWETWNLQKKKRVQEVSKRCPWTFETKKTWYMFREWMIHYKLERENYGGFYLKHVYLVKITRQSSQAPLHIAEHIPPKSP